MFRGTRIALAAALLLPLGSANAAPFISEIYLDSPGGLSIEVSDIDPTLGATLIVADAKRFDTTAFSNVLDAFYLTAATPANSAELFSTTAWPATVPHRTLDQVSHLTPTASWSLGSSAFDRLLLLYEGTSPLGLSDNPVHETLSNDRHAANPLADYLLIGPGDLAAAYTPAFIAQADAALGTDLLARTADRNAGTVIARTYLPGQDIDLNNTLVGNPDNLGVFPVENDYLYLTSPGQPNLPLVNAVPEPGALALLACAAVTTLTRRRRPH